MRDLLQTVIPAALTALVAGRVAVTRTGRLRSTIQANVALLDTLPADHPSREDLASHIEDLVDTLVLREQRQFDPLTRIGAWISLCAMLAAMGLVGAIFLAIDPLPLSARAAGLGLYSGMVVVGIGSAIAGVARLRRERDLEDDDEDDDQEPELEDDRAIAPA